jgi:hypothetical protein
LKEIHKAFDMIGRLRWEGRSRVLDFSPSDSQLGKNAAGLDLIEVGRPEASPTLLADVIEEAKKAIARTAAVSAEVAKAAGEWQARLAGVTSIDSLNAVAPDVGKLAGPAKTQVWNLVLQHGKSLAAEFDKAAKKFVPAASAA